MTDTPVPDVRTLIADEYARFLREEGARDRPWDFADGLVALVDPVIRGQERAAVAEEIHDQAAKWHAACAPYQSDGTDNTGGTDGS